jgi:hypothetical protein
MPAFLFEQLNDGFRIIEHLDWPLSLESRGIDLLPEISTK